MTENHMRVPRRRVQPGDAPLEQGRVVRRPILRFLGGLAAVLALLAIAFAVVLSQIHIIPELQDPRPGEGMIGAILQVRAVELARRLLAEAAMPDVAAMTWLWALYPQGEGQTRLVVRMHIQPAEASIPAPAWYFVDAGGFVMENKMMRGIRERAEGYVEPGWMQGAEIGIWLIALGEGLAAAWFLLTRKAWAPPLLVGLAAVLALVVFTFVQPSVWLRALVDVALAVGLWRAVRGAALP